MKRSELRRTSFMNRGTGTLGRVVAGKTAARPSLKPRSKKRVAQERVYAMFRKAVLEHEPACGRCGQLATEIHHMAGRRGNLLNDMKLWLPLCRPCHRWVTVNPKEAVAEGFSLPRTWVA